MRICALHALLGLGLCQTQSCAEEAVERRTGERACAEDGERLFPFGVSLFHDVTDDERDYDGQTVDGGADEKAGGEEYAKLAMTAEDLDDGAGNGPDEQPLCDLGGCAGVDRGDEGLADGNIVAVVEVSAGEDKAHDEGDAEAEKLGAELLLAALKLKLGVGAAAAEDVAALHVIGHVGEARAGGGDVACQNAQRERREAHQHTEDEEYQRAREGGEPARMHRGDADDKLRRESGEARPDYPQDEHGNAHIADDTGDERENERNDEVGDHALGERALHPLHAGGELAGRRGGGRILALEEHHAALDEGDDARADHDAVGHVVDPEVLAVDEALAEDVGQQRELMPEEREHEAVRLYRADDYRADAEGGHCAEVAEPGNAQKIHRQAGELAERAHCHTDEDERGLLALFDQVGQALLAGFLRVLRLFLLAARAVGGLKLVILGNVRDLFRLGEQSRKFLNFLVG